MFEHDLTLGTIFEYTKHGKTRIVEIQDFNNWGADEVAICNEIIDGKITDKWVMIYCTEIVKILDAHLTEGAN